MAIRGFNATKLDGTFEWVEVEFDRGDLKQWLDQIQVRTVTSWHDHIELEFGSPNPFYAHIYPADNMQDILEMYRDCQPILDAALK